MKNEHHLAYKTSFNYPIHISSPDSVRAHIKNGLKLIAMLPAEFPRVRGRFFENKQYEVLDENTFTATGVEHKLKRIVVKGNELPSYGVLIDDAYFLSDGIMNNISGLSLMFSSFKALNVKPTVRREWSYDYPSSNPFWYSIVEKDSEPPFTTEQHYDILGYEELGIDCLADLMAYSYKFVWDFDTMTFNAITDEHEITKRLRKPWVTFLCQQEYGEGPHVDADLNKLIKFLIQKMADRLSTEEMDALNSYLDDPISSAGLERLNQRNAILNQIMAAYNHPQLITPSTVESDPLLTFIYQRNISKGFNSEY